MKDIFLVSGYGIPRDILKDKDYDVYLKSVFKKISKIASEEKPILILCGGPTDMTPPFKRTEAREMERFFLRKFGNETKNWEIILEDKSLSSLENIIFAKKLIDKMRLGRLRINIFCEKTRKRRIGIIAEKVFGMTNDVRIIAVDFETNPLRKLNKNFLLKKERTELEHGLWALETPANLKKHHELFKEKFDFLRNKKEGGYYENVEAWWKSKLEGLRN